MSWQLGEPHEFSAATRARIYRRFERDLERRFPGYRFTVGRRPDEQEQLVNCARDEGVADGRPAPPPGG